MFSSLLFRSLTFQWFTVHSGSVRLFQPIDGLKCFTFLRLQPLNSYSDMKFCCLRACRCNRFECQICRCVVAITPAHFKNLIQTFFILINSEPKIWSSHMGNFPIFNRNNTHRNWEANARERERARARKQTLKPTVTHIFRQSVSCACIYMRESDLLNSI